MRVLIGSLVAGLVVGCAEERSAGPLGPDESEAVDPNRAAPLRLVPVDERTRVPLTHRSARVQSLDVDESHAAARGATEAVVVALPPPCPHGVELLGMAPVQDARWTLCFVPSVAGSLAARERVANGTGVAAAFDLDERLVRLVARGGTWVVLDRDGFAFGTLAQPHGPVERLDLIVPVRATGAITVAFDTRVDAGPPAPLRMDDEGNRLPVSGAEVLVRPLDGLAGEPWIDERLAAGRWIPAGTYAAELRSLHLVPWRETVGLAPGECEIVLVPFRERGGATTVRLSIDAAPGTDGLPTLVVTSRSGAVLQMEPRAFESTLSGDSKRFAAYTRLGEGMGVVEIEGADPAGLCWRATQPGTLSERARSQSEDAVHIELEWYAAPPAPSYEIRPNDRFEPGGSRMRSAPAGDRSHEPR